jgi:hypothetical protein
MKRKLYARLAVGLLILASCSEIIFVLGYRPSLEKLVTGTWFNGGRLGFLDPVCLHIFANHTYTLESTNVLLAHSGTWSVSGLPGFGTLILGDWYHGSEVDIRDGNFSIDVAARTLTWPGIGLIQTYKKDSDISSFTETESERFVLGSWFKPSPDEAKPAAIYFFTSDHRFASLQVGVGKWRVEGDRMLVDWSEFESEKVHHDIFFLDLPRKKVMAPDRQPLER